MLPQRTLHSTQSGSLKRNQLRTRPCGLSPVRHAGPAAVPDSAVTRLAARATSSTPSRSDTEATLPCPPHVEGRVRAPAVQTSPADSSDLLPAPVSQANARQHNTPTAGPAALRPSPATPEPCTRGPEVSSASSSSALPAGGVSAPTAAASSARSAGPLCGRRTAGGLLLSSLCLASAAATTLAAGTSHASPGQGGGASGGSSLSRFAAQATAPSGQEQLDRQWRQQQRERDRGEQLGEDVDEPGGQEPALRRRERRSWPTVPLVPLAPGLRVSKVIRGCWQLSGRHKGDPLTDRTSGTEALADLLAFHRAGITTLDTADNYGPAETLVGQYGRLHPRYAATTKVATKLSYVSDEDMAGVSRTLVEYAVRNALARQSRTRLDLVQLQWADPVRHRRWMDVLMWLAELREEGLIGHIGVCNFGVPQLAKACDAGVKLVSNQVQFSLVDRRPQLYLQKAAASYGVKLLAYGTMAGGLLADKYYGLPANRVRLDTASKQKYGMVLRQSGSSAGAGVAPPSSSSGGGGGWGWMQEVLEATRAVGERHGVSSSAVALAWVLHQPQVAAAIVGARNARHIGDMQAGCSLQLDDVDLLDLDAVWEGVPNPPASDVYVWERGGPW